MLSLNKNLGSQKSIAIGLKYLENKKISQIITIMDSDGEDDPSKINEMINEAKETWTALLLQTEQVEKALYLKYYICFINCLHLFYRLIGLAWKL